jgi:hypothetical protein
VEKNPYDRMEIKFKVYLEKEPQINESIDIENESIKTTWKINNVQYVDKSKEEKKLYQISCIREDVIFKDRKKQLDKLMKEMPLEWRYYWCNPKSICACMGCANRSGGIHWKHKYTREEWEEWVKENPDPRKDESPK